MSLIEVLQSLFTDYTLRNVALGGLVLGITSGALGSFAVLRKQSLLGDAASHAALPGVALVFILTGSKAPLALMIGAGLTAWAGALLVNLATSRTRIKQDSGLGIVLAVFFGLGIVLISWIQRNMGADQAGIDKYLFGQSAAIVGRDVLTMALVGGGALLIVALLWKEFKLITFDAEFAAAQGLPVQALSVLLTSLIVVGVVVGLQMVGVVLMSAMIVAPAAAARQWTDRFGVMVGLASLFGAVSGVTGALISSLSRGLATGPVIVLCVSTLVFISILMAPQRGLIWAWLARQRRDRGLEANLALEALYEMAASHHESPDHPHAAGTLRAVLPSGRIKPVLMRLQHDHMVRPTGGDQWALTNTGIAHVEAMRQATGGGHLQNAFAQTQQEVSADE